MTLLQNIRSALVSKVLPVVQEKFSVISAKVTYNTSQETRDLDKLWLEICAKRDACDRAIKKIKGMATMKIDVIISKTDISNNV